MFLKISKYFAISFIIYSSLLMIGCSTTKDSNSQNIVFEVPNYKKEWSSKVYSMLSDARMVQFNKASKDFKRFCPKYDSLSKEGQKLAWGYLIGSMTKFESNYKPTTIYKESDGSLSEGLFQLTYGNKFCPKKKSEGDLQDPIVNIDCAVQLMAHFIALDSLVAAGGYVKLGTPEPKGLARYWAVIRVPDSKSKHKLKEIIEMTKIAPGCSI